MQHLGFPEILVVGFIGFFYIAIITLIIYFAWRLLRAIESIANSISKIVELKQPQ